MEITNQSALSISIQFNRFNRNFVFLQHSSSIFGECVCNLYAVSDFAYKTITRCYVLNGVNLTSLDNQVDEVSRSGSIGNQQRKRVRLVSANREKCRSFGRVIRRRTPNDIIYDVCL